METNDHFKLMFSSFCDKSKIRQHFVQFMRDIQETNNAIELKKITAILNTVKFLDQMDIISSSESMVTDEVIKKSVSEIDDLNTILLSILEILCTKHLKIIFEHPDARQKLEEIDATFVAIAYLMQKYIDVLKDKNYYEIVIVNVCYFFEKLHTKIDQYTNISESEFGPLYYSSLEFLIKILKSIPSHDHELYVSEMLILRIFDALLFPDNKTVKLFLNFIFPYAIQFSQPQLQEKMLSSIWNIICVHFNNEVDKMVTSEPNSCSHNLLCCLAEHIFSTRHKTKKFYIHNENAFWNIVLAGVTSNFISTRKKALMVFKSFLLWFNEVGYKTSSDDNLSIFVIGTEDDMKIWNDVVVLFESLEEKQIHVIKPVLPKFSRILSFACKQDAISPASGNLDLPSAWLMALIQRMLQHESKSIIRWALSTFLTLDYNTFPFHKRNSEVFIKFLVEAFNEQSFYSRNETDNYSPLLSSEKLSVFLKNYIDTLGDAAREKVACLRCLISTIASQSWSVVALLHVTSALTTLNSIPSWNQDNLLHIRKIIMDSQRSQEPAFRAALESFMLENCSLFLDWNSLQVEDLAELLFVFKSTAVVRFTEPWMKFALRLQDVLSSNTSVTLTQSKTKVFCMEVIKKVIIGSTGEDTGTSVEEVGIQKAARIFVMLADSSAISSSSDISAMNLNWISLLDPVILTLKDAFKRPYMDSNKFLSALKLVVILIKECHGCNKLKGDAHLLSIVHCMRDLEGMPEFMHQMLFTSIKSSNFVSQNVILFEAFQVLSAVQEFKASFISTMQKLREEILDLLDDIHLRKTLFFPAWRILNTIVFNLFHADDKKSWNKEDLSGIPALNYKVVERVVCDNILAEFLAKPTFLDESEKEQYLNFSHKIVCDFWDISALVIQDFQCKKLMLLLVEETQKTFNGGPKLALPHVINCLKYIIPILGMHELSLISDLLDFSWEACFEIRGNEAFRPSLNALINAIFQPGMLQEEFFEIVYKYFAKFKELSENTSGIFCTVIKQFCKAFSIKKLVELKFDYVPVFVSALTYGPIHQKGSKIMEETLIYLIEHKKGLLKSLTLFDSHKPSFFVRITVINYLSESLPALEHKEEFSFALINSLLNVDDVSCNKDNSRKCRYANSLSHRLRNRAWQAILFLLPAIENHDLKNELVTKTLASLGSENQQPSIRYLQEWAVFTILSTSNTLCEQYISLIEQSLEKRPSHLISFLSILNLLILRNVVTFEHSIIECYKLVTVLCMAQNFNLRLHAQLCLINLCSLCERLNLDSIVLQYEFVSQITKMQLPLAEQGNFFKNVHKLSKDFYFYSFDPVAHFTFETIFFELPRLSNLSPDEWIKPSLFSENSQYIPICNQDEKLKNSTPTSFASKSNDNVSPSDNDSLDYNFQKKIIPVKNMLEDGDSLDMVDFDRKRMSRQNLVVVASLINRPPNLGGLCRTCEIFGVAEFVISNLRYTQDKDFQTLAVSADKWVRIREVKPLQLKEYLISMKEDGYTLVGAEQTDDGCCLTEYKFDKKTVLLLGQEKEGLPVDLIQLLDMCVEIPQQGVIRSLNVHVSGAILIWEYARQYNKLV